MYEKKYEFTNETMTTADGHVLHRIRALKDFDIRDCSQLPMIRDYIEAGDLGGWIENEDNLSHAGGAWVHGEAQVFEKAYITGNAQVMGAATIFGEARIFGNARVFGGAVVRGGALITDHAEVYDGAIISGYSIISESAQVYGNAKIGGSAKIRGKAIINQKATISSSSEYLVIGPIGSRNDMVTFFWSENLCIMVNCGCFHGTIAKFKEQVNTTHGNNQHAISYNAAIQLAETQLYGAQMSKYSVAVDEKRM